MHPGQGPGLSVHDLGEESGSETVSYILEQAAAQGAEFTSEQVHAVVETQMAYTLARVIMAGAVLGVFDALAPAPATAAEVAERCGTDPGATEKLREAEGWVEKARAEGWYEPDDKVDAVLPFVNRELGWDDLSWLGNAHSFELLLGRYIGEGRGLKVLEIGAAKAWAARFWRERECEFVATDIVVDPNIGLGRGAFYGDFGRVQADGEHLPFADGAFSTGGLA